MITEKEREERIDLLCEKYSLVKDLVAIFGVPEEYREDLVQDIMVSAYRNIHELREIEKLNSWLYKIAYRSAIFFSKERKLRLEREVYNDVLIEDIPDSSSREAWELCDGFLEDEDLADMVASLKPPAPIIIRLRFGDGYSLKEIAEILNMNYSTVKVIEHRAFKQLKAMIIKGGKGRNVDMDQEA